jgi:hypothetical protein
MVEANPVKFYLAKYLFLGFGIIQWTVAIMVLAKNEFSSRSFFIALIFFTMGLVLIYLFMVVGDKIKRVAIGKNKIVIVEGHKNVKIEWTEVKSLTIVPYFNLYKMKVKGRKGPIYFFPSKNINPAFGIIGKDTSRMGEIVERRKKEFGIK